MKQEEIDSMLSGVVKNDDVVSCDECKCLVRKADAHNVSLATFFGPMTHYYCGQHKKPYDKHINYHVGVSTYYGRVEMLSDGTPVGYQKIKPKS